MHPDAALAGPARDSLYFGKVEHFTGFAAHRCFDLQSPYGNSHATRSAALGCGVRVLHREGGLSRREWNHVQPTQGLAAVAAIVVKMTFVLHQHTTLVARKQTDG